MFIGRVKFQFQLASLELRIVRLGIFAPPTNKVPNVCRLILGDTVFHKQVDFSDQQALPSGIRKTDIS